MSITTPTLQTTIKDCAVCLQACHHPTQLPCGHIFCFLCVKGIAIQNKKCAMCRAAIPSNYLEHPVILEKLTLNVDEDSNTGEFQWFYEGRNGWWKYDERSNAELEAAWAEGSTECVLLLAGTLYSIDFRNMLQTRRNDPTRKRRVRRDAPTLPAKGIAGIKIINESKTENVESPNLEASTTPNTEEDVQEDNESLEREVTETTSAQVTRTNDQVEEIIDSLDIFNLESNTSEANVDQHEDETTS